MADVGNQTFNVWRKTKGKGTERVFVAKFSASSVYDAALQACNSLDMRGFGQIALFVQGDGDDSEKEYKFKVTWNYFVEVDGEAPAIPLAG